MSSLPVVLSMGFSLAGAIRQIVASWRCVTIFRSPSEKNWRIRESKALGEYFMAIPSISCQASIALRLI